MRPCHRLQLIQQLNTVPTRNTHVTPTPTEDGSALEIAVQLRYGAWMRIFRGLFKLPPTRRYLLEGIGRHVYERIDGQRTFEQLVDDFKDEHKLTFFEARSFLMEYLSSLLKNGLIVIVVKETTSAWTPIRPAR